MYPFAYHCPSTLAEASSLLSREIGAKPLAGGQSLIPVLKHRLVEVPALVDLAAVDELVGIRPEEDSIVIGAMSIHADVAASDTVEKAIPALGWLAGHIGDPQIRNCGTIGGAIASNDPAADYPAALLALGATVRTTRRELPAAEFFVDSFETALAADELVVAISFPIPRRAAYARFPNPVSGYPIAGVFVAEGKEGNVRLAVTGAGATVFRVPEMEQALEGSFRAASLDNIAIAPEGLNTDLHAGAQYRAHLVSVMAKRAVARVA